MSYYGSFVLQCYVLRMRVMTSTVGGNLTNRPPALRHIHVNMERTACMVVQLFGKRDYKPKSILYYSEGVFPILTPFSLVQSVTMFRSKGSKGQIIPLQA